MKPATLFGDASLPVRLSTKRKLRKLCSVRVLTVVLCSGIKYGGAKEWEFCWEQYNKSRVPSEKKLLLKVLGVASDPWLLQRYKPQT